MDELFEWRRVAAAAALVATVLAAGGCDVRDALSGKAELTGKVKEVVDRTHTIRTTYSIYYSNWAVNNEGVALRPLDGGVQRGRPPPG